MAGVLSLRGVREHNLKGVDIDIERERLTVLTGVSGSGKTSFAFGTLFAESQRRFVDALAPQARGRFGPMRRPAFDTAAGLLPALGVSQRGQSPASPRSTVGTLTDIHDLLRVLWARVGVPHCPRCGARIEVRTADEIVRALMSATGARVVIAAPVARKREGDPAPLLAEIAREGFTRVRIDGVVLALDEVGPIDRKRPHDIDIVIDRIRIAADRRDRVQDAVATAVNAGHGAVVCEVDEAEHAWSTRPRCVQCDLTLPDLTPRLFSFHTPPGACSQCLGLGVTRTVTADSLLTDADATLAGGAIEGGKAILEAARLRSIPVDTPWRTLPWEARSALLHGDADGEGAVQHANQRIAAGKAPERLARLVVEAVCGACAGARLGDAARGVAVDDLRLPALCALPLGDARAWIAARGPHVVVDPIREELVRRLGFLLRSGLGHLTLDRTATTLSAGELQRVRLAAQVGNQLVGMLYVLDEPTAGLHPRDTEALIDLLLELRDAGNTVLVVEHDPAVIRRADRVLEFGPGAGSEGGRIVFDGTPEALSTSETATGRWLSGRDSVPRGRPPSDGGLGIRRARGHNLRGIDVFLPLGAIVAITGVSGAGKSSLAADTLGRAVTRHLSATGPAPLPHDGIEGIGAIRRLVTGDAVGFGRSARANVATATRFWDDIRELYSRTNEAKLRGFGPDRFSFNTPGGRCEACAGEGVLRVDLLYLPSLVTPCDVCDGKRFEEATLAVTWRGASIADVLATSVRAARELFAHQHGIARALATLDALGLGYLPLGQPADSWSGGEAHRVSLARELGRPGEVAGTLYLLDEPSVGLHPADIATLLVALRRLVDAGGSVILVDHDPILLAGCDWVVELGPGAGNDGGAVIYAGPPRAAD